MEEIKDSGKVWCKGNARPVHAIRIQNKIFTTGKTDDQTIKCWVEKSNLCVDLNDLGRGIRVAKKLPLELEPTIPGTLFNGFTHTKHADVLIVGPDQDGVEERTIYGENYRLGQYKTMSSKIFWDTVWS